MAVRIFLVGTVEAQPGVEEILQRVQKAGFQTALLAPLMLVAGDHAQNDMAGDAPDSWKNLFLQAGIAPICDLRGLGEHEVVRKMYTARLAALAEE